MTACESTLSSGAGGDAKVRGELGEARDRWPLALPPRDLCTERKAKALADELTARSGP